MHDSSASVRKQAIALLEPVQSDSSVRQVLRTVSTQDENPYIRTASYEALQGTADIQEGPKAAREFSDVVDRLG